MTIIHKLGKTSKTKSSTPEQGTEVVLVNLVIPVRGHHYFCGLKINRIMTNLSSVPGPVFSWILFGR